MSEVERSEVVEANIIIPLPFLHSVQVQRKSSQFTAHRRAI